MFNPEPCEKCGGDQAPSPEGTLVICYCGRMVVSTGDGFRDPTEEERNRYPLTPENMRMLTNLREVTADMDPGTVMGKAVQCLACGVSVEAAHSYGDAALPGAGTPAVCSVCGYLAAFTGAGLQVRHCTEIERRYFLTNDELREAIEEIKGKTVRG